MRILIGCGGTGGHIYPGVSIADALKAKFPEASLLFVGAQGGMELDIVAAAGYQIAEIHIRGWQRKKIIQNVRLPFLVLKSLYQARTIIKRFKPDLVIGTGGYACFPTLLAAYGQNIPTLIQEQNSIAGLATTLLSNLVTKVCTGYPAVALPCKKEKIILTGNPIRPCIYQPTIDKVDAFEYFKFNSSKKCLLIMGGSGGASQLNTTLLEGLPQLQKWDIQIVWITGNRYFTSVNEYINAYDMHHFIRCYPFLDHIEIAYAAADVVISRAGALSIAELCAARKPTILVPSPHVVGDHQTKNGLPLADQGAVVLIPDHACARLLLSTSIELLYDEQKKMALIEQMHAFALLHSNALDRIVEVINALLQSHA